jgi:hypothetical protein
MIGRMLVSVFLVLVLSGGAQAVQCDNCTRVAGELAEAHAAQADVDRRLDENLDSLVSLASWRDDIQLGMVQLLAESDHGTDSWQIRYLLLEWEWTQWSAASADAVAERDWLLEEKAEIDHTILLGDEALHYDCEAVGTG